MKVPKRILIVDDEPLAVAALERTFQMAGYDVRTATNAKSALGHCEEHAVDLVIIDFVMPTMNGIELLGRIRRIRPLVRSVVVSGKIDKDANEAELSDELRSSVEADCYVHKPVANEKLLQIVGDLLANPRTDQEWKDVAKAVVAGRKTTVKAAKDVSKKLKQRIKRKK